MSKKTQTLILALQDSIDKLGIDKTISNLKESSDINNKTIRDFIIYQVCDYYNVNIKSLKTSNAKAEKKVSHIISYLLYYQGHLTQEEIGSLLGRSKASVNRYLSLLLHYSTENDKEKNVMSEISVLENQILQFKNKIYG